MFSDSKMSQIDPRRGGQHFSNKSQIQKSLKNPIKPIWDIVPNFPVFNERKLVLGPLDVKVKVKPKKFRTSLILSELPEDL